MAQGFENKVWMMKMITDCDKKFTLVLNKIKGKDCLRHGWKKKLSDPMNVRAFIKTLKKCSAMFVNM